MMANPGLLQYDPLTGVGNVTVGMPEPWSRFDGGRVVRRQVNETDGGVVAVHLAHFLDEYDCRLEKLDGQTSVNQSFMREVEAAWAWIGKGGRFKLAMDALDLFGDTLDGSAAAGQKVIPLTNTAGIVVGNYYRVDSIQGEGWQREIVQVASIVAGVSVTAVENLKFNFVAGDEFYSKFFFPRCVAEQDVSPISEGPHFDVEFRLRFRTFFDIETA
jgi:hypothetical protein